MRFKTHGHETVDKRGVAAKRALLDEAEIRPCSRACLSEKFRWNPILAWASGLGRHKSETKTVPIDKRLRLLHKIKRKQSLEELKAMDI